MNYEVINQLAKEMGCKVTDLIPLAPQNDPFYTGTPTDWAVAEWFAQLWQQFGYRDKVHIRRVHYQIVSQRTPVLMPNSKPYENTSECWDMLNMASKAARYLQLVDPAAFSDRRNDDPVIFAPSTSSSPFIRVYGNLWQSSLDLPDFPEVPEYGTGGFTGEQRYHLEVWCEKSTMNDVLLPLCQRYGANLQTGSGELSITATLALADRLREVNKPARIFYVADFDLVREEYTQLREEFTGRMQGCRTRLLDLWQAMKQEMALSAPRLDGYVLPQAAIANEIGEGLYDSTRDYIEQIEAYKEFQGRV